MAATDRKLRQGLQRLSLQAAALAVLPVQAAEPPEAGLTLRQSLYQEADLPADQLQFGSNRRYRIHISELQAELPLGRRQDWGLRIQASHESMSGASPMASIRGENDQPRLLMSGATIRETRNDLNVVLTRYRPAGTQGLSLYLSEENDYRSRGGGWFFSRDFDRKHTTFSLSAQAYQDRLRPTDAELYGRIVAASKQRRLLEAGLTRVINAETLASVSISRTWLDGYLSDPYKLADVRPDRNGQWTASLQLRHFWKSVQLAQHLDWRYYKDDFGTRAHTWQLSAFRRLGPVHLGLSLRAYRQSAARFYTPFAFELPPDVAQSSDFRLSAFGALAANLSARWQWRDWALTAVAQRYHAEAGWGLDRTGPAHPALLDFSRLTLELHYRF